MPLPAHIFSGAERFRSGNGGWWRRRRGGSTGSPIDGVVPPSEPKAPAPSNTVLVDAHTRTFWARGADASATLVEAGDDDDSTTARRRVAELVRAHEAGEDTRPASSRPRGNPVFSEALFVELMRAHQYKRAYELLSADCQRRWGSVDAFAAAQGAGTMRRLRGVTVRDVRYLPEWTDQAGGTTYEDVAELRVEYAIGERDPAAVVPRVVHLVPDRGRWRSLCYPA